MLQDAHRARNTCALGERWGVAKTARLDFRSREERRSRGWVVDRLWPHSLALGARSSAHTQRRRKANAIVTNPTGAMPAIQSQWTKRPNSGLIVALATMATPTNSAAQKSETGQVLEAGGPVVPPPLRPLPVALLAISHLPRLAGRRFQQSQHRHNVRCEFGAKGASPAERLPAWSRCRAGCNPRRRRVRTRCSHRRLG